MKVLIFGDIFGRNGRKIVKKFLPELQKKYTPDFLIGNSENICGGTGPRTKQLMEMKELGFDVFTGGNHIFRNIDELEQYLNSPGSIQIRPANYFTSDHYSIPGKGYIIVEKWGKKLLVMNLMSSVFLRDQMDNPYLRAEKIIEKNPDVDGTIVDFHRETTSELFGMAKFLEGRASFVYGTHTHVQTADERILPGGTGMITDIGFVGAWNSMIGDTYESRKRVLLTGIQGGVKREQDMGPWVLSGCYIEIEDGKCVKVERVQVREGE